MSERFYRIAVRGVLTERLAAAFEPLGPAGADDGRTLFAGVCADSAALYGVLDRIRDLGLELVGVESSDVVPTGSRSAAPDAPPAPGDTRAAPPIASGTAPGRPHL